MSFHSSDGTDADLASLAGLYALDALESPERERFEALMQRSPELSAEVAEFRETAARLSASSAEPAPASMRGQVLGSLSNVRQVPPQLDVARDRARSRAVPRRWVAAAAAAVVLVVVGATFAGYSFGVDQAPTGAEVASEQLTEVLAHDDAQMARLTGEGDAAARVVFSDTAGTAVVLADGMPAAPAGHTYELWKLREGEAVSAGLFDADEDGRVRSVIEVDLAGVDTLAVTVEPAGGSDAPTTDPVMIAEV